MDAGGRATQDAKAEGLGVRVGRAASNWIEEVCK